MNCSSSESRLAFAGREIGERPLCDAVVGALPLEEAGVEDARAQTGRADRDCGEEALIAVVERSAFAETAGELADIIPLADRKLGHALEQPGRPRQRLPARHAPRPALTVVAEEQFVAAFAAQHDLHMLRCGAR